jgi:hypothetical protein
MPLVPYDKRLHLAAGATLAIIVQIVLILALGRPVMWAGMGLAVLAGLVKEANDRWENMRAADEGLPNPHGVEVLDIVATAFGGIIIDFIATQFWRIG